VRPGNSAPITREHAIELGFLVAICVILGGILIGVLAPLG
jgi:hypothetical protein